MNSGLLHVGIAMKIIGAVSVSIGVIFFEDDFTTPNLITHVGNLLLFLGIGIVIVCILLSPKRLREIQKKDSKTPNSLLLGESSVVMAFAVISVIFLYTSGLWRTFWSVAVYCVLGFVSILIMDLILIVRNSNSSKNKRRY